MCSPEKDAEDSRRAFLPAVLADNKTKLHFRALDEANDVDQESYCWRRSGFFWRMRASLGLACAHYPVLSGFRQRQPAAPRRAPTCLSLFT